MTTANQSVIENTNKPYKNHICEICGHKYDVLDVDKPEDATYYWVPSCPCCKSSMSKNPPTKLSFKIKNTHLKNDNVTEKQKEEIIREIHYSARLYHGKLVNKTKEELIEIAQKFDNKSQNDNIGPRFYRDIAFRVRKQARNM